MRLPLPMPVGVKKYDPDEVFVEEGDCDNCKYFEWQLINGSSWANCKKDWFCAKEEIEDAE